MNPSQLKNLRVKKGISLRKVAKSFTFPHKILVEVDAPITFSHLAKIEKGDRKAPPGMLEALKKHIEDMK